MDHSNLKDENLEGKKCPHGMCMHGQCLNHKPEWEDIGDLRFEPDPWFFGKKTYWLTRCCGAGMARHKQIQGKRCRQCGRREDDVVHHIARCQCCGSILNRSPFPD